MQSGIPVSPNLQTAFQTLTSNSTLFALPVTIISESLTPGSAIPYTSSTADLSTHALQSSSRFYASLSLLGPSITPSEPCYLLIRRYPEAQAQFIAVTYIPSNAPVRKKTLFASTRATLVRDLGSEKFAGTVFATEVDEVIGEAAWKEREERGSGGGNGLLGQKERELEEVKRAEEEEKSHLVAGTAGRDTGLGGGKEESVGGLKIPIGEGVEEALKELGERTGGLLQLGVDLKTEVIILVSAQHNVQPSEVQSHISLTEPRYTFYHYPSPSTIIFIYTCPPDSKIRERMVYASSRRAVEHYGVSEGLKVDKKIEAAMPDEVSESRLAEEVKPKEEEKVDRGFARPKRPGRR